VFVSAPRLSSTSEIEALRLTAVERKHEAPFAAITHDPQPVAARRRGRRQGQHRGVGLVEIFRHNGVVKPKSGRERRDYTPACGQRLGTPALGRKVSW